MNTRLPARKRVLLQPLSAERIRKVMQRIFPRRNDYIEDMALYEELLPELESFGIVDRGGLKRLMTKHRRNLLRDDRSTLAPYEIALFNEMYGEEEVQDTVRRQYWFAYPALIRNALESEFGEDAFALREDEESQA